MPDYKEFYDDLKTRPDLRVRGSNQFSGQEARILNSLTGVKFHLCVKFGVLPSAVKKMTEIEAKEEYSRRLRS